MNVKLYRRLDALIAAGQAGTTVDIGRKLKISPRSVRYMLTCMRSKFECPIVYNRKRKMYYYSVDGNCSFRFEKRKLDMLRENFEMILQQMLS